MACGIAVRTSYQCTILNFRRSILNFKKWLRGGTTHAVDVAHEVASYFVVVVLVEFTTTIVVAWGNGTIGNFSRVQRFNASKDIVVRLL